MHLFLITSKVDDPSAAVAELGVFVRLYLVSSEPVSTETIHMAAGSEVRLREPHDFR